MFNLRLKTRALAPSTVAAVLLINSVPVLGAPVPEIYKVSASDGAPDDAFGHAVAISAGIIAVGAPHDDINGATSGSAYLYDAASATQLAKLVPADGGATHEFGASIAIDGGVLAVGAPGAPEDGIATGAVYIFDIDTGAQLTRLTPPSGQAGDLFGSSVAIDAGTVAVGAMGSSSAYLFDAASGAMLHELVPQSATASLGVSIAIDGGTVAVGSRSFFVPGEGFTLSAVFLFDAASGRQSGTLTASNGTWTDFFAETVDIDDGLVAVGAWAKSIFFDHSGAAYIFDAATGQQLHYIVPDDGHDKDNFGISVAINDGVVAIGAHKDGDKGMDAGSAYLYDATSGALIDKLLADDGDAFDYFGTSIAIDAGVVAVGAIGDEDNGPDSGAVYVYGDAPANCDSDLTADGVTDSADLNIVLAAFGSDATGDVNGDGLTDSADLNIVLAEFGNPCN